MSNKEMFKTKNEAVDFISDYLIKHDNTIAIVKEDMRKDIIKSVMKKEDFNKISDTSNSNGDVLYVIKTGDKSTKNLKLKVCDAYSSYNNELKMVDINNLLLLDGLISDEEMSSITYYEEFTKLQLA